jgi:hypothetical protein
MKRLKHSLGLMTVLGLCVVCFTGCLEELAEAEAGNSYTRSSTTASAIDLVFDVPEHTYSDLLEIPGRIGPGLRVFVNELEMELDPLGSFTAQVRLRPDKNYINLRVVSEDGKSIYATAKVVHYTEPSGPWLEVEIPTANNSKNGRLIIRGVTNPNSTISANGHRALPDERGNFIVEVPLREGDNVVRVVATDPKGKTATAQQVVNYTVPKNLQPMLIVSSPEPRDGYVSSERLRIVGFTDPNNIIEIYNNYYKDDNLVKSLVFRGTVPLNGQFSVDVNLSTTEDGVNDLQIVATNGDGGTAMETRRVTYKDPYAEG